MSERPTDSDHEDAGSIGRAYEPGADNSLVRSVPALARIAAAAYWRSARWTVRASGRATARVFRAATTGERPSELFRSTSAEMRESARRALGISEPPAGEAVETGSEAVAAEREEARRTLRERGAELLHRSADVNFEEDAHPAYARILDQLAPDEARILRLLRERGPQPSVDVRAGWVPLKGTSELIAAGLQMIGAEAGCRHLEDVPAYLNNLFRLGLIWFSREQLSDPLRYQVLEAQPEVAEALQAAGHTSTVRRSIHLTPFGRDFCDLCLPAESAADVGEPDAGEQGDPAG
jgi:hypothetical protein